MGRPRKKTTENSNVVLSDNSLKLAKENEELRRQLAELNKTLNEKLLNLVAENKKLKEDIKNKDRETFVGIRSVSGSNVWLAAPESKMGEPGSVNKGRLLKSGNITIVPSYWVVEWITSGNLCLKMGDIVIDNEAAKKISANVDFADIKIPDDFYLFDYTVEQIKDMAKNNIKAIVAYVNKHKNNVNILNSLHGILTSELEKYEDNSPQYADIENVINRIVSYLSKDK